MYSIALFKEFGFGAEMISAALNDTVKEHLKFLGYSDTLYACIFGRAEQPIVYCESDRLRP